MALGAMDHSRQLRMMMAERRQGKTDLLSKSIESDDEVPCFLGVFMSVFVLQ
jgi:hypothetical protein